MQKGIVVAGYIGVDVHKEIAGFPGPHDLVNIKSVSLSLGGLVSNCARRSGPARPAASGVCLRFGGRRRLWQRGVQGAGQIQQY